MSQGYFKSKFTGAVRAAGQLSQNDAAAEQIVLLKVYELMVADAVVGDVFQDRIEVFPVRNIFDRGELPRLQIYAASTTEISAPTAVAEGEIEVFCGIRFDGTIVEPLSPPTAGSVLSAVEAVRRVLRTNRQLTDKASTGVEICLANNSNPGPVNWIIDPLAEERMAYTLEVSWVYEVSIDNGTGKILSILKAGGD